MVPCSCVRPDETSATVRCHYLRDGTAKFAFTVGRAEFFIPVGILLKCFLEASDKEAFTKLLAAIPQDRGEPMCPRLLLSIMLAVSHTSKQGRENFILAVDSNLLRRHGRPCTRC